MNNYTEKRKYKRIELDKRKYKEIVSPCIARFRAKQLSDRKMPPLDWNIVAVKNLSAGGIKINYYKENLEIGSLVDFKIEFIKSKPTISCIGRVVRIDDAHANSMFRIGIEFIEIDEKEREIINTTVEAILRKETQRRVHSEKLVKTKNHLTKKFEIVKAKATDIFNVEKASQKTKYEPVDIAETNKEQEKKSDEPLGIKEEYGKTVLGNEAYDYHAKSRKRTLKKCPATAFIVAYMVLMLTLGFIVHRDLRKQLIRVETKLDNVVSKVYYPGF
jgi:hypothetical protein